MLENVGRLNEGKPEGKSSPPVKPFTSSTKVTAELDTGRYPLPSAESAPQGGWNNPETSSKN